MFNDAIIVENRENAYIRGVIVYKNIESIVFLKFQYQVGNKKYETEVPFEKEVVKKCETKVIESKNKAELTGMIVSTNNKRINRIELKWADGDSSVIGW